MKKKQFGEVKRDSLATSTKLLTFNDNVLLCNKIHDLRDFFGVYHVN